MHGRNTRWFVLAALALIVLAFVLILLDNDGTAAPSSQSPGTAVQQTDVEPAIARIEDRAAVRTEVVDEPAPEPIEAPAVLAHIRGRCVDQAGTPLAGCVAKLGGSRRNQDSFALQGEVAWTDPEPVTTAADGRFDIAFATPSWMQFSLDIEIDGHVPRTGRWGRIEPDAVIELGDVVVQRGFEVRGRVVDEDGLPVDGVGVMLRGLPLPIADEMAANSMRGGFTDGSGAFRVSDPIPPGTWSLDVQARGFRLVDPDRIVVNPKSGAAPVLVTVRRMPTIEGIVVDEVGAPIQGVTIRAELHRSGRMASARSREDGAFTIHAVDANPQPVALGVQDPGPAEPPTERDERLWDWGSTEVRFVLRRAVSFELTVVEHGTGTPVTRYAVRCYSDRSNSSREYELRLSGEHPDGRVVVDRVWRGWNRLLVVPLDDELLPSEKVRFEATDAGAPPQRVEVVRLGEGTVRVTDTSGAPVSGSKVESVVKGSRPFDASEHVQPRGGGSSWSSDPSWVPYQLLGATETGADGHARIAVPPTDVPLLVRVTGRHPPVVVDPARFDGDRELQVVVPVGGSLIGRVVLAGIDTRRVQVSVSPDGESGSTGVPLSMELDAEGRFAQHGMTPGSYRIQLDYRVNYEDPRGSSRGSSFPMDVEVPDQAVVAGRDTEVLIDATACAPARVRARVLLDGGPPEAARAFLQSMNRGRYGMYVPDPAGVFEAEGLLPGEYRAALVVGDFQAGEGDTIFCTTTFTLRAGEELVRDFAFQRRRLVVKLLQADGKTPAGGTEVIFSWSGGVRRITTDADGDVVLDPVPVTELDVHATGLRRGTRIVIPAGETTHEEVLVLDPETGK